MKHFSFFDHNGNRGFAMVETLISLAISAMLVVAFFSLLTQTAKVDRAVREEFLATMYLRESIEAAKDLEVSNWSAFPATCPPGAVTDSHVEPSGGVWILVNGSEVLEDIFTRTIRVEAVFRSALTYPNEIVSVPGECDPDTKKITAEMRWDSLPGARTLTLETYVYN